MSDTQPCVDAGEHIPSQRHARADCPVAIAERYQQDEETTRIIAQVIQADRESRHLVYTVTWTTTIKETYEAAVPRWEFDQVLAEGNGDSYLGDLEDEKRRLGVTIGGRVVFVNGEQVEW